MHLAICGTHQVVKSFESSIAHVGRPFYNDWIFVCFNCSGIYCSELPANSLLMPTVGNGHLATVVFRDRIFMNGLYNGEGNKSHRAAIPALNLIKLKLQADSISEMYSLHCIQG